MHPDFSTDHITDSACCILLSFAVQFLSEQIFPGRLLHNPTVYFPSVQSLFGLLLHRNSGSADTSLSVPCFVHPVHSFLHKWYKFPAVICAHHSLIHFLTAVLRFGILLLFLHSIWTLPNQHKLKDGFSNASP